MNLEMATHLKDLAIGSQGYIVGYDKAFRGYIGRLLQLGLAPETRFIMIRPHFPDPFSYVIEVQGKLIQLSRPEADALCIETVQEGKVF